MASRYECVFEPVSSAHADAQLRRKDLLSKHLIDEQRKRAEFEKDMLDGKALLDARHNEAVRDLQENFQIWKEYSYNPSSAPPAKPAPASASLIGCRSRRMTMMATWFMHTSGGMRRG